MAKVLFVNPVVRAESVPKHVPYGIALLAAIAIKNGHQVQVFDHNAWRMGDEVLKDVMQADKWDVIAAGGITTAYGSLKTIYKAAKTHAPQAVTIAGGGFLTSMPHDIMKFNPAIDVGVVGEAFLTFPELLAAIDSGIKDFSGIDGVVCRDASGETTLTAKRQLLMDLDSLPYPAWELFPLEEVYFPNSSTLLSEESMGAKRRLDMNASYGCNLICRFCFHLGIAGDMSYVEGESGKTNVLFDAPKHHPRSIRYHSPRYIVDMAHYMVDRFNVDFIAFLDENLMTMNTYTRGRWLNEICDLWIAEGLQPPERRGEKHVEGSTNAGVFWGGTSHASLANPEILKKMAKAGCSYLDYGWESFSPQILKTIGKGATPENNVQSYHWTMDAGIRPIPNQMIGFPTEDFDSLRDSMKMWKKLGIVCKPFFATPYPGCEWFHTYKDKILEQYDGDLEGFILDVGDATEVTATICENFDPVELYGLRELMIRGDFKRIDEYEKKWRDVNGDPKAGVEAGHKRLGIRVRS